MKIASCAVVKTSGRPPAWGQSSPSGHRHGGALVHHRELRLTAAAHHGHHASALGEAGGAGAGRDDLSSQLEARDVGGEPGGAG